MPNPHGSRQVVFVFGTQSCVPEDPLKAAKILSCRCVVIAPRLPCGSASDFIDRFERVNFGDTTEVIDAAQSLHSSAPLHAVVAYDDQAVPIVARIAAALGLPGHPIEAADAARDKVLMKERLLAAGLPIAKFHVASGENDAVEWANATGYPVVLKPICGSASQGVIRADNEENLRQGYRRLHRIVRDLGLETRGRSAAEQLVESYLDGAEYSVELVVQGGLAEVFCEFEKPKPLCGPYFEETIYVTPTHLSVEDRCRIRELAISAVKALRLRQGVVHCEIRISPRGVFILELGARLIGGACSRVFRKILGTDIHNIVLRLALGDSVEVPQQLPGAAGAMMLPIPREGRVRTVSGVESARATPGIDDVIVTIGPGDPLIPFPEQSCYVGFLTASGRSSDEVTETLESASSRILFDTEPLSCESWTRAISDHFTYKPPPEFKIRTLDCCGREDARRIVLPLIAQCHFSEYPDEQALDRAQECLEWFEHGNQGETSPEVWLVAGDYGVALGSREGNVCHPSCVGVVAGHKRKEVAQALVESMMALFANRGCTSMQTSLDPRQPSAMGLFRQIGFEREISIDQACNSNSCQCA